MASIAHHHLPVLSLILTALLSTPSTNGKPPCAAFDCGNGLTLTYPFHLPTTSCGYPNLTISCINNQPILHIANNPYTVTNFNSSARSITVAYGESCPIATHPVGLESGSSVLNYNNAGNKMVRFYYNCTAYPASTPGIKCLQRGGKQSYAFVEGSESEAVSGWMRYCESNVTAPVMEDQVRNGSILMGMRLGFELRWGSYRHRACQVCEESGGFCGYNSNYSCFCGDQPNNNNTCDHVSGEFN